MKLAFSIICFMLSGVAIMTDFSHGWSVILFLFFFLLGIVLILMHECRKDTEIFDLNLKEKW